jgi:predicted DNA-binding protein
MRPDCDKDRTMSTRTKKTVATSLSPEEVIALDRVRKRDNLTRAQALREAIRRYVSQDSDRQIPVEDALPDEIEAIEEGQAQIARGEYVEYVLLDDLKHEMGRPPKQ